MIKSTLKSAGPWLVLFIVSQVFFIFIAWIVSPDSFKSVALCIILFTCITISLGVFISYRRNSRLIKMAEDFLERNDEASQKQLEEAAGDMWRPLICSAFELLASQRCMLEEKQLELTGYQEFIEEWTHEIKTPLTVMTLMIENHKEDMSPYVYRTMEHIRSSTGSSIEKILYYARLQGDHVDYKLERIPLKSIAEECLYEFESIAREKMVDVQLSIPDTEVICDKRVLTFMLSQLLSNAFKYTADQNGMVLVCCWEDEKIHLAVRDNGKGAPKEDIPFLFDKGFTGSCPERQNATGIGLYLVKKYADALSLEIEVEPDTVWKDGFGIELKFPKVE